MLPLVTSTLSHPPPHRYLEDIQRMKREVDEKYSKLFHEKMEGMREEMMKLRETLFQKDSQLNELKNQMKSYAQQLQVKWKEVQ